MKQYKIINFFFVLLSAVAVPAFGMEPDEGQEVNAHHGITQSLFMDDEEYLKNLAYVLKDYEHTGDNIKNIAKVIRAKYQKPEEPNYKLPKKYLNTLPDYKNSIYEFHPQLVPGQSLQKVPTLQEKILAETYPHLDDVNNFEAFITTFRDFSYVTIHSIISHPWFTPEQRRAVIAGSNLTAQEKFRMETDFAPVNLSCGKDIAAFQDGVKRGAYPDAAILEICKHVDSCSGHPCGEACSYYDTLVTWLFTHYPFYTANKMVEGRNPEGLKSVLGVIKSFGFLQWVFKRFEKELSPEAVGLFFAYGAQPSRSAKNLLKHGNIERILLYQQAGMEFNDPALLPVAMQSGDSATFSFMLDQFKKEHDISPETWIEKFHEQHFKKRYFPAFQDNTVSGCLDHAFEVYLYQHMLHARLTGDVRALEELVIEYVANDVKNTLDVDSYFEEKLLSQNALTCASRVTNSDHRLMRLLDVYTFSCDLVRPIRDAYRLIQAQKRGEPLDLETDQEPFKIVSKLALPIDLRRKLEVCFLNDRIGILHPVLRPVLEKCRAAYMEAGYALDQPEDILLNELKNQLQHISDERIKYEIDPSFLTDSIESVSLRKRAAGTIYNLMKQAAQTGNICALEEYILSLDMETYGKFKRDLCDLSNSYQRLVSGDMTVENIPQRLQYLLQSQNMKQLMETQSELVHNAIDEFEIRSIWRNAADQLSGACSCPRETWLVGKNMRETLSDIAPLFLVYSGYFMKLINTEKPSFVEKAIFIGAVGLLGWSSFNVIQHLFFPQQPACHAKTHERVQRLETLKFTEGYLHGYRKAHDIVPDEIIPQKINVQKHALLCDQQRGKKIQVLLSAAAGSTMTLLLVLQASTLNTLFKDKYFNYRDLVPLAAVSLGGWLGYYNMNSYEQERDTRMRNYVDLHHKKGLYAGYQAAMQFAEKRTQLDAKKQERIQQLLEDVD